jgi:pentatricopeptide repeat domain-containing protein 1
VEIYTAAITACSHSKQLEQAFQLLKEMKAAGIQPNVVTITALMQVCNRCKQWQQAVALYEQLEHSIKAPLDRRTLHEAVRAYQQLGNADKVTELKTKTCSDIKQCGTKAAL